MVYCVPDLCLENEICCGNNLCCSNTPFPLYIIIVVILLIAILVYWSWLILRRRRTDSIKVCDSGDDEPLMNSVDIRTVD